MFFKSYVFFHEKTSIFEDQNDEVFSYIFVLQNELYFKIQNNLKNIMGFVEKEFKTQLLNPGSHSGLTLKSFRKQANERSMTACMQVY